MLSSFRLTAAIPTAQDRFIDWWSAATLNTPHSLRKGFASLAVLTAWSIWRHRNVVLFDSARPSADLVTQSILDGSRTWALAGARGLAAITQFEPP